MWIGNPFVLGSYVFYSFIRCLGGLIKASDLSSKSITFGQAPKLAIQKKCLRTNRKLSVRAEYKYVMLDYSMNEAY